MSALAWTWRIAALACLAWLLEGHREIARILLIVWIVVVGEMVWAEWHRMRESMRRIEEHLEALSRGDR